jgi:surface protein
VSGQVTVVVSGQMAQFGGNHDITGLVRMDTIGYQLGLTSLEEAFRNVTPNTTYVNPALPPQVTSLRGAFRDGNPGFDVGSLDTSNITDMSEMFLNALDFNGDLSGLDTSSVTTMERMFYMDARLDSTAFNQPWDTSSATDMSYMFAGENAAYEHRFDNGGADGIRSWNVSSVTDFEGMFQLATPDPTESVLHDFNQPLDGWDTAAATSMKEMFKGSRFTRALDGWDVSNVQDFSAMFSLSLFNASLAGWDFSSATTVENMLYRTPFNADTTGWRLPADAARLMHQAKAFNHASALTWNTSGVTSMEALFWGANDFNQDISGWDVSTVTTMKDMFRGFTSFNRDISGWDVSSVSSFDGMFYDARGFSFSLGGWPLSTTGVSMSMIWDTTPIHGEPYSRTLIGWANTAFSQDGPFSVPLTANDGAPTYTATVHASGGRFQDAVSARAFLARSRRVLVASAGTADADGEFLWNGATQQFEKANGWRLIDTGTAWELHDATGTVQATAQDATMPDRPYKVAAWDGVLASASVDLDGMGWTIIDGGLV